MVGLEESVDRIAAKTRLCGVVRVDQGDEIQLVQGPMGSRHHGFRIPNTIDRQSATAGATKGLIPLAMICGIRPGETWPARYRHHAGTRLGDMK